MKDRIVNWNVHPEIFTIMDTFPIRYYGLFWVLGLGLGYLIVKKIYQKEKIPLENLEQLSMYIFIGAFLGARLGHCLFYQPEYFLQNPLEILLPITKINGAYQFSGFQGLASHGGVIAIIISIIVYARKTRTNLLWIMDRVAIGATVTAALIRLGNLMNSEIYGKPTNGNWGFVFERDDLIPRHPTQLYEAFSYLLIFGLLMLIYKKRVKEKSNGLILAVFLVLFFSARFVIEFLKENQIGFEDSMTINMGQILSIPFIILGFAIIYWKKSLWGTKAIANRT